jgi:hypothetical protein
MEKLNIHELKELMRIAFNSGVSTGKKMTPIDRIPMGAKVTTAGKSFDVFFKDFCEKLKDGTLLTDVRSRHNEA